MPRIARYPHMEKQGRIWYGRLDIPRDLRHHFIDERHPNGRRVLSKSTGQTTVAAAYEVAKPIIEGWKAQFVALRREGKTATQMRAEQLAKKYATARKLDQTEAEYIRLVEVFDFAARELVGVSARVWHERLATSPLDPAEALRSMPWGDEALEQVEAITGNRTPFLAKIDEYRAAVANALDGKTAYEYEQDTRHFAAMFPGLTIEGLVRQHVQDFIKRRMIDHGKARATVAKQVSGIRSYWTYLCSQDEALRERRPFADLIWPTAKSNRSKPTDPDFQIGEDDDGPRFDPALVPHLWDEAHRSEQLDLRDVMIIAAYIGGRREAIASLHRKTVFLDSPIPYLVFHWDKSESGRRRLPIHPAAMPILQDRFANAPEDGYLFRGGKNKIGDKRSPRLARPFRDVLNDLQVPAGYGFHSFRRTFVDLLANAPRSETRGPQHPDTDLRALCLESTTARPCVSNYGRLHQLTQHSPVRRGGFRRELKHNDPLHDWDDTCMATHRLKLGVHAENRTDGRLHNHLLFLRTDNARCLLRHKPKQPAIIPKVGQRERRSPADGTIFGFHGAP